MFSQARILCPQEGQVEAGLESVTRSSCLRSPSATSKKASHWQRHSCCIIFGRRRMTTFKKLPMHRETKVTTKYKSQGVERRMSKVAIQKLKRCSFKAPLPSRERGWGEGVSFKLPLPSRERGWGEGVSFKLPLPLAGE